MAPRGIGGGQLPLLPPPHFSGLWEGRMFSNMSALIVILIESDALIIQLEARRVHSYNYFFSFLMANKVFDSLISILSKHFADCCMFITIIRPRCDAIVRTTYNGKKCKTNRLRITNTKKYGGIQRPLTSKALLLPDDSNFRMTPTSKALLLPDHSNFQMTPTSRLLQLPNHSHFQITPTSKPLQLPNNLCCH